MLALPDFWNGSMKWNSKEPRDDRSASRTGTRDDHSLRSLGRRMRWRRTNYFASERGGRPSEQSEADVSRTCDLFPGRRDLPRVSARGEPLRCMMRRQGVAARRRTTRTSRTVRLPQPTKPGAKSARPVSQRLILHFPLLIHLHRNTCA
jgi:hypothetical protein